MARRILSLFLVYWCRYLNHLASSKVWHLLFFAIAWSVWLCRNNIDFDNKVLNGSTLFDLVLVHFGWLCKVKSSDVWLSMGIFLAAPNLFNLSVHSIAGKKRKMNSDPPVG